MTRGGDGASEPEMDRQKPCMAESKIHKSYLCGIQRGFKVYLSCRACITVH